MVILGAVVAADTTLANAAAAASDLRGLAFSWNGGGDSLSCCRPVKLGVEGDRAV
jgi:hypothetical protein